MNRRIALVAIAAVLALFGTFAVYNYAHNADKRAVAGAQAAQVLIAAKDVPAGTSWADAVKGGYLTQENIPADAAPQSALPSVAGAGVQDTQVAAADITPGQIVLRQMFGEAQAVTGVLAIPAGKIAVTVTMNADADVANFVQPQSEVAVFVTGGLTSAGSTNTATTVGSATTVTRMLLPRVQVIATSQSAPTDLSGSKSNNSSSAGAVLVTLALTQQQAEQVILGHTVGQLYMGLLSNSSITSADEGVSNAAVIHPTPIFLK